MLFLQIKLEKKLDHPEFHRCYKELDERYSYLLPNLTDIFDSIVHKSKQHPELFPHLHLGYSVMSDDSFEILEREFPWLHTFRMEFSLRKRINFLETNREKPIFLPHIDGRLGSPQVMLNTPIKNCTHETTTFWVQPTVDFEPVPLAENGTTSLKTKGATPHLPPDTAYYVFNFHSFQKCPSLFRSDVYHGVHNNSSSSESRIMCHWWFNTGVSWDDAVNLFL